MIPQLEADYLFLGPLLEGHLNAQVPSPSWRLIETLDQAKENSNRAAVGYVMWDGDRFDTAESGRAAGGSAQMVYQRWLVLLLVRSTSQATDDARNRKAGPLLTQIHKAVAGWKPEGLSRGFTRAQGRNPSRAPNQALLPLTFEIQLSL